MGEKSYIGENTQAARGGEKRKQVGKRGKYWRGNTIPQLAVRRRKLRVVVKHMTELL